MQSLHSHSSRKNINTVQAGENWVSLKDPSILAPMPSSSVCTLSTNRYLQSKIQVKAVCLSIRKRKQSERFWIKGGGGGRRSQRWAGFGKGGQCPFRLFSGFEDTPKVWKLYTGFSLILLFSIRGFAVVFCNLAMEDLLYNPWTAAAGHSNPETVVWKKVHI